ncbi:UDP-glucose 4-epimerase [Nymphon striatum]|nr:UDP-glucose 4-epimerase [Nymphon striatum]
MLPRVLRVTSGLELDILSIDRTTDSPLKFSNLILVLKIERNNYDDSKWGLAGVLCNVNIIAALPFSCYQQQIVSHFLTLQLVVTTTESLPATNELHPYIVLHFLEYAKAVMPTYEPSVTQQTFFYPVVSDIQSFKQNMSTEGKCVLVTGGAGYIGSHSIVELLNEGYKVVAVDNFVNSIKDEKTGNPVSLERVEKITGKPITFYEVDIRNYEKLDSVFKAHNIDCVIHFAALKSVGESCQMPLHYYQNNISGSSTLLEVMKSHGVKKLVFSSSATVYGYPNYLPIDENHVVGTSCTNPYGRTKYFMEEVMKDVCVSEKGWTIFLLRYFNPVGAHSSGLIGEDPRGIPNNLMPYISQVAVGRLKQLNVYGSDYDTRDGTGVRDYIHVVDLAQGHVAALNVMLSPLLNNIELEKGGWRAYNLGTGTGYSVMEAINTFEGVTKKPVPYKIAPRREGDVAAAYADPSRAQRELGWRAKKDFKAMYGFIIMVMVCDEVFVDFAVYPELEAHSLCSQCEDTWRWQSQNPKGFLLND